MEPIQRQFTSTDQSQFATMSGDFNPIHMDSVYARRTQAGAPVVHGIHLLLWALECFAAANGKLQPLRGLRAHFTRFVFVGEYVEVTLRWTGANERASQRAILTLAVDGSPRSRFSLEFGTPPDVCPAETYSSAACEPFSREASNLTFEQMSEKSGRLRFAMSDDDASRVFPSAVPWLGARFIAALASTSHLVGMVCPGLHSIYSELRVIARAQERSVVAGAESSLTYRVAEADLRFRSVKINIWGGGLTGIVESVARIPPVRQVTIDSLAGLINPNEFTGSVALIVGGSRGLGELTAKIIAAGGGQTYITWKSGEADAHRVAEEIRVAGGDCRTLQYDARHTAAEQLATLTEPPTHVYYFATPTIFKPQSEVFSSGRLAELMIVYVDGFWELLKTLRGHRPNVLSFYPSSVFVDMPPAGMTEYAMAKAAGEVLCAAMNASTFYNVTFKRLPRMLTDQTASTVIKTPVGARYDVTNYP